MFTKQSLYLHDSPWVGKDMQICPFWWEDFLSVNNCPDVTHESLVNLGGPLIVLDLCGSYIGSAKNVLDLLKWKYHMFLWIAGFPSYLQNKNDMKQHKCTKYLC